MVLAASSNDNGLLHQEVVDFELPPPLGWPDVTGQFTNDVEWCANEPFAFVSEDRRGGVLAAVARRAQMHTHWRSIGKFARPTEPGGPPDQPTAPCDLSFGRAGGPGEVHACRGPKTRTAPTSAKTCYAWCNGTAGQTALSIASIGHVRWKDVAQG